MQNESAFEPGQALLRMTLGHVEASGYSDHRCIDVPVCGTAGRPSTLITLGVVAQGSNVLARLTCLNSAHLLRVDFWTHRSEREYVPLHLAARQ